MDIDKRILVVDDEPITVAAAVNCLNKAGYHAESMSDGATALAALMERPDDYSVVIANRLLPHLSGIELLAKIKANPTLHNLPVIIETVDEDQEDYLAALEAGASDYIYKPLEKDFLLYVVDNAISH